MYETYGIYNGEVHRIGFDRCDKFGYDLMVRKDDIRIFYEKKPFDLRPLMTEYEKFLKDGAPQKNISRKKTGKRIHPKAAAVLFGIAELAFLLITAKIVMLIKGVG